MAHLDQKEKELIRLFALGEELSEQEALQIQRLIDSVEGARDELDTHTRFKNLMTEGKNHVVDSGFVDETMRRISTYSLPPETAASNVHKERFRISTWFWPSSLAPRLAYFSVLIALLVGYVNFVNPKKIIVPAGEQKTVLLADQTEVMMSSGSSLLVIPATFRSLRKVVLEGEAYFDVMPGEKPFVVETFNAIVTVKGTQFNVRAYPNRMNQKTEVSVEEGRVEVVATKRPDQMVRLEAGQGTLVQGTESVPEAKQSIEIEQVLNWQSGGFTFVDEPLLSVLNELERRFAVPFNAPPHLHGRQLSYLNNKPATATEVLEAICESLNLSYRETAVGFEVLNTP